MRNKQSVPAQQQRLRRVVVVGCCGAGKSHFSAQLAHRLGLPQVERDTLGELGSDAYRGAVAAVVSEKDWVFDGPPYFVDTLVYSAAQKVVWLDYSRTRVVWQATRRALRRTFAPLPAGLSEGWRLRQWIAPGGPRFANSVYADRKREFQLLEVRPECVGKVLRFVTPADAQAWLTSLPAVEE